MNLAFTAPPPPGSDSFTDTGISGGHGAAQERELQAWKPDNHDTFGDVSLMDMGGSSGWSAEDMFATNSREHGYQSSYNEDEYTTKINKNDPEYMRKMRKADQLAREIQSGVGVGQSQNPHTLADRGIATNMSEEEMHASVLRKGDNDTRYVPPSMRKTNSPTKPPMSYSSASKPKENKWAQGAPTKNTAPAARKTPEVSMNEAREFNTDPHTKARTSKSPEAAIQDLKSFAAGFKLNSTDSKSKGTKDSKEVTPKLNANATEFKMSAAAPAFVMGGVAAKAEPVEPAVMGSYPMGYTNSSAALQAMATVPHGHAYAQQQQAMSQYQQQMYQMQQQQMQMAQRGYGMQQIYQMQMAQGGYPKGVPVVQSAMPQMAAGMQQGGYAQARVLQPGAMQVMQAAMAQQQQQQQQQQQGMASPQMGSAQMMVDPSAMMQPQQAQQNQPQD